jgi:hypothetical protein
VSSRAVKVLPGERTPNASRWPVVVACDGCGRVVRVHGWVAYVPRSWRVLGAGTANPVVTCAACLAYERRIGLVA